MRVGVAGLGRGRLFVDLFNNTDGCEVVAVCDPMTKALEAYSSIAAHTDYDEFLKEDLDIVAVITPGPVHAAQSVKAMEAGAHVLCETPCIYSFEEAQSIRDAAARTGRQFMLAEDYVWMGWVVRIKEKALNGEFGEIVYAEGDYTHDCRDIMLMTEDGYVPYRERDKYPHATKSWRCTDFPPLVYVSHTLGPLLHIMDDRITDAVGMSTGTHTAPDLGTIDLESALFHTEKGAVIRLTNGFTVAHPYALYYNLVGTKGSVKLMRTGVDTFVWYSEKAGTSGWEAAPAEWFNRPDGRKHVEVMVQDFVNAIRDGRPTPLTLERSLDFVLPGVVAHASAMNGSSVMYVDRE